MTDEKTKLSDLFKKTFPFWEKLDDSDKDSFINSSQSVHFPKNHGEHISVFAIGGEATVNIKGLEYECENLTLTPDLPIGVSNSSKDCPGIIEVSRGYALIMVSGDFEKIPEGIDKGAQ